MNKSEISFPLNWTEGVKNPKKFYMGMNWFQRADKYKLHRWKKIIQEYCLQFDFGKHEKIRIHYSVYFVNLCRRDVMNAVGAIDKFVLDYMVNVGAIPDDSFKYVDSYTIGYKGKSKINKLVMEIEEI